MKDLSGFLLKTSNCDVFTPHISLSICSVTTIRNKVKHTRMKEKGNNVNHLWVVNKFTDLLSPYGNKVRKVDKRSEE